LVTTVRLQKFIGGVLTRATMPPSPCIIDCAFEISENRIFEPPTLSSFSALNVFAVCFV
jgi:hypothetical protein